MSVSSYLVPLCHRQVVRLVVGALRQQADEAEAADARS
jgi:hypothetical protein